MGGELGSLISSQLESNLSLSRAPWLSPCFSLSAILLLNWLSLQDGGGSWASHLLALPLERKWGSFRSSNQNQIGYKPTTHGSRKGGQMGSCFGYLLLHNKPLCNSVILLSLTEWPVNWTQLGDSCVPCISWGRLGACLLWNIQDGSTRCLAAGTSAGAVD